MNKSEAKIRERAKITHIGTVENGMIRNWGFDGTDTNVAGIEVHNFGREDQTVLYAGYTIEELADIADWYAHFVRLCQEHPCGSSEEQR